MHCIYQSRVHCHIVNKQKNKFTYKQATIQVLCHPKQQIDLKKRRRGGRREGRRRREKKGGREGGERKKKEERGKEVREGKKVKNKV